MSNRIALFLLAFQGLSVSAQTLSIDNAEVCAAQEVLLPVSGTTLTNVGALTLFIGFDPNLLSYDTVINVDPLLAGMSFNLMTSPFQLACAWSSTAPISISSGKLFDIRFVSNGQTAPVSYNPGCELADPSGTVIPAAYISGAVNSGLPLITLQPSNVTTTEGNDASFTVSSPNALSYFWMESQDSGASWMTLEDNSIFTGTHTSNLLINQVPLSFNTRLYKCALIRNNCQEVSGSALLTVDALSGINPRKTPGIQDIKVSPVPFSDHLSMDFVLGAMTTISMTAFNMEGIPVFTREFSSLPTGRHHININTAGWQPGVYVVTLCDERSGPPAGFRYRVIKTG